MKHDIFNKLTERLIRYDHRTQVVMLWRYLHKYNELLTDEEFWSLLIDVWSSTEANSRSIDKGFWLIMLKMRKPLGKYRKHLPQTFTIYRGGHSDGLSWTTSKAKAKWFQKRKKKVGIIEPLSEKKIKREEVIFYDNGRKEKEVVILNKL